MRLFNWIIEFKLKRKENKDKLRYLAEKLISELEAQGFDTNGVSNSCKYVSIFDHGRSLHIGSVKETIIIERPEVSA